MAAEVSGYVGKSHRAAVEDHVKRRAGLLHFLSGKAEALEIPDHRNEAIAESARQAVREHHLSHVRDR
ncbi:hypothetical protein NKY45_27295 [Sinorhizobium meliloti]